MRSLNISHSNQLIKLLPKKSDKINIDMLYPLNNMMMSMRETHQRK
jgi:hypothetical protein